MIVSENNEVFSAFVSILEMAENCKFLYVDWHSGSRKWWNSSLQTDHHPVVKALEVSKIKCNNFSRFWSLQSTVDNLFSHGQNRQFHAMRMNLLNFFVRFFSKHTKISCDNEILNKEIFEPALIQDFWWIFKLKPLFVLSKEPFLEI